MRLGLTTLPVIVLVWTTPILAEPDHASVNRELAEGVITPTYVRYNESMQALTQAIGSLCEAPSDASLSAAQEAYNASADAWQRLQPIAFGPVETKGLDARIHFWPDKHGTAGKQLSKLLAKPDPAALENGVDGKSAALQSLAALERVLFDQADTLIARDGDFACNLALAIADFQGSLADDVLDSWQGDSGHAAMFTEVGDGNDAYYDAADATTDLFGAVAAGLDNIVANKLERPLGKSLEKAKPKRAEDWRSERSLPNIIANLETIKALYTEPSGLHVFLSEQGQDGLDETIRKGLDQTIATATSMELSLFEAVGDETARKQVEQLLKEVKSLRALFTGTLADAASLTVGFNKSDGD
ncbi:MAG: imelysin family protein [Pseudomonadota bacterium]